MRNFFILSVSSFLLSACNVISTNSGTGIFFTDVKEPVSFNSGIAEIKTGEACQESFFGLISTGDSSVKAAKENGNINKVASVEITRRNLLVYGIACTVVKGE